MRQSSKTIVVFLFGILSIFYPAHLQAKEKCSKYSGTPRSTVEITPTKCASLDQKKLQAKNVSNKIYMLQGVVIWARLGSKKKSRPYFAPEVRGGCKVVVLRKKISAELEDHCCKFHPNFDTCKLGLRRSVHIDHWKITDAVSIPNVAPRSNTLDIMSSGSKGPKTRVKGNKNN
jgi:hypothetical protein